MANLLLRLHNETFVLNTRNPVNAVPVIANFAVRQIDAHTLEADISKEQNLNELFSQFTALGIEVLSMRNKVNRLEEIFMRLVEHGGTHAG
jgi:ABC-2 type transport system ATP-binding protein